MPTSGSLALIAALPRELALLARDLRARRLSQGGGTLVQSGSLPGAADPVLLATAGMGANRVALAVEAALARGPVAALLSVGLAGACDPQLTPGSSVCPELVVDTRTGERFSIDPTLIRNAAGTLVTAAAIAGPAEKLRLHQAYGASAVDMEAATVARLAQAHGIPFGAIKAISEEQAFDLTHLSRFAGPRGEFRTPAFVVHTLMRPSTWSAATALGRGSRLALASLTHTLHQLVLSRPAPVA